MISYLVVVHAPSESSKLGEIVDLDTILYGNRPPTDCQPINKSRSNDCLSDAITVNTGYNDFRISLGPIVVRRFIKINA